jgi:hypothetical protein
MEQGKPFITPPEQRDERKPFLAPPGQAEESKPYFDAPDQSSRRGWDGQPAAGSTVNPGRPGPIQALLAKGPWRRQRGAASEPQPRIASAPASSDDSAGDGPQISRLPDPAYPR